MTKQQILLATKVLDDLETLVPSVHAANAVVGMLTVELKDEICGLEICAKRLHDSFNLLSSAYFGLCDRLLGLH